MPAHRKPGPDAATLHRLYVVERLTAAEIGLLYGMTKEPIRKRLIAAGIARRPKFQLRGGIQSPEHEQKLRESRRGANSHWWRGGVSSESTRYRASAEWSRIRRAVYERDNWLCQDCGCKCLNTRDSKNNPKQKIQCHHIVRRRDGGQDTPDNLVTLCMSCHHKRERRYDTALFA